MDVDVRTTSSFFDRALQSRWARLAPVVLALVFGVAAISIGFYADDYSLLAFVEQRVPHAPPAWDLYRFMANDPALASELRWRGILPWWVDLHVGLHLFRPITSLLFAGDHALFGRAPLGYHLHSLLWYLALVTIVGRLHEQLFSTPSARLATLLYTVSAAHAMPWGWISARHLSVAGTFAGLALLAHLAWRRDGSRFGAIAAPPLLLAALLAGESGIGGIAFVVAYELFGTKKRRVFGVLPALSVLATYLVLYGAAHAGARNGSGYIDPLGDPVAFALVAVRRLPLLIASALMGAPAELGVLGFERRLYVIALAGAALFAVAYGLVWRTVTSEDRRNLGWLLAGALASVVVALGGFPGARQLVLPNIAVSALVAVLSRAAFASVSAAGRIVGAVLIVVHGLFAPVAALVNVHVMSRMARQIEAIAAATDVSGPRDRPLFVIASDPMIFVYVHAIYSLDSPPPGSCWSVLSAAKGTHRIVRTAPDTLELEVEGTTFLRGPFETIYRSQKNPFHAGEVVDQCGARFRVLEMRDDRPARVEVQFDAPLDSPHIRILAWQDARLRRIRVPSETALEIPWSPGPMGTL